MTQKGFTLIELLFGLIILAVGLLGAAGMQLISIKGNHFGSNLTQATVLCQSKLEELKALPFFDPNLSSGKPPQQITESGIVYTVGYDVNTLGNSMKKITTTVQWLDRGDHSITLSTIKAR